MKEDYSKALLVVSLLFILGNILLFVSQMYPFSDPQIKIDPQVTESFSKSLLLGNVIGIAEKKIPVIITFKEKEVGLNEERKKELIQQNQEELIQKFSENSFFIFSGNSDDLDVKYQYAAVNALAAEITEKGLKKLKQDTNIKSVDYDSEINLFLDGSMPSVNANDLHQLAVNNVSLTGAGEVVCVVDTGVDYTHPALGGCTTAEFLNRTCAKVIGGFDVADNDSDPRDLHSHGTHVAGIVASIDNNYKGVAPDAKIVAVKIFPGSSSSTSASNLIAGLDWCKNNKENYGISIVTLSLGDNGYYQNYCDEQVISQVVNDLVDQGIFVDVASGNNGYSDGLSAPACASKVVSVGSTDDGTNIASYSNSAAILDLLAPGNSVNSLTLNSGFSSMSGTSMASPHVAGAAALIRQYWQLVYDTLLTPSEIEERLELKGTRITDPRNGLVFSRIDLLISILPEISFKEESVDDNALLNVTTATISITADLPLGQAMLELRFDQEAFNLTMGMNDDNNFSYILTNLSEGNYTYLIYGINDIGLLSSSAIRSFSIDLGINDSRLKMKPTKPNETNETNFSLPKITVNNPLNNSYHHDNFDLDIFIEGDSLAESSYAISNSSGEILQIDLEKNLSTNFTWTNLVNLSNLIDGHYRLSVLANNTEGNYSVKEIQFACDQISPQILTMERSPEEVYAGEEVTFLMNVSDDNLDASAIYLNLNISGKSSSYQMVDEDIFKFILSNFTVGNIVFYTFTASDLAGNTIASEGFNFTVLEAEDDDEEIMVINITSPINNSQFELGEKVLFSAEALNARTELLKFEWFFDDEELKGEVVNYLFESTGNFTVVLIVETEEEDLTASVNLIITDETLPAISNITYLTGFHLEDEEQEVEAEFFDLSGIAEVQLISNEELQLGNCSTDEVSAECAWKWEITTEGDYDLLINIKDNSSNLNAFSYDFTVFSCSDNEINGEEEGIDCGGPCSLDCDENDNSTNDSSNDGDNSTNDSSNDENDNSGNDDSSGSNSGGSSGGGSSRSSDNVEKEALEYARKNDGQLNEVVTDIKKEEQTNMNGNLETMDLGIIETLSVPSPSFSQTVIFNKDEPSIIEVEDDAIIIKKIKLQFDLEQEAEIKITPYSEPPQEVVPLNGAYQYLNINLNLPPEKLESAIIIFSIPPEWFEENKYIHDSVALYTFTSGKWEKLRTKKSEPDALTGLIAQEKLDIFYEAEILHFSFFAVAGSMEEAGKWYKIFKIPGIAMISLLLLSASIILSYFFVKNKKMLRIGKK